MKKILLFAMGIVMLLAACSNNAETNATTGTKDSAATGMDEKEMKETRNRKTVSEIMDAFNAQDLEKGFSYFSPDVVEYFDGNAPPLKGADTVKKSNMQFFQSFSNLKGENIHIAADGDWVMVWATWSATWSKDFAGQKATGKSFKAQDVDVFKFDADGKIIEHHAIQPFSTITSQIGMKM